MNCRFLIANCRLRTAHVLLLFCLAALLSGCTTQKFSGSRRFDFQQDTFAFANELKWEYHFSHGQWVHERREPPPEYSLHCFVLARSARQFFQFARFDPTLPIANDEIYRKLIRRVVKTDPTRVLPESEQVVIPGYANLRAFSEAKESLLKSECGGAWESYFQRGHWRMVWPFSRAGQQRMAEQLVEEVKVNRPPIIHVARFPQLSINHAMVVFDASENAEAILFSVYDPNQPGNPRTLTFDRASRTFTYPSNNYWPGGRVDVYEIYRNVFY